MKLHVPSSHLDLEKADYAIIQSLLSSGDASSPSHAGQDRTAESNQKEYNDELLFYDWDSLIVFEAYFSHANFMLRSRNVDAGQKESHLHFKDVENLKVFLANINCNDKVLFLLRISLHFYLFSILILIPMICQGNTFFALEATDFALHERAYDERHYMPSVINKTLSPNVHTFS